MGHLISARIEATALPEYYAKLCELQGGAHGKDYLMVHDEIRLRMKGCDSYTEFGINQGATLAAALLEDPKVVRAYDIRLGWYKEAAHLFDAYSDERGVDYRVTESSTLDCVIDPVDVLYIDTVHEYKHLRKELARHGDKARRFIIVHDTHARPRLKRAVQEYACGEWSIVTDCDTNVGFMTIERAHGSLRHNH